MTEKTTEQPVAADNAQQIVQVPFAVSDPAGALQAGPVHPDAEPAGSHAANIAHMDDDYDEEQEGEWFDGDPDDQRCHYCDGEGWGIVGCDWDTDDAINGPYDGEIQRCPCCHGSGDAKDCCFW